MINNFFYREAQVNKIIESNKREGELLFIL